VIGWTCGVAVLLAAALAVGCGRDASGPEGNGPLAPSAARLVEGALVRTTVRDALAVPREGASPAVQEMEPVVAEAVVASGRAVDERCGAVLAARAGGAATRELSYTDEAAHRHRLVVARGSGGGPVQTVRYERDGEVVAEATYRWDPVEGGYVLRERTLTLFRDGRVVVRQARRAGAVDVIPAAAAAASDAAGRPDVLRQKAAEIGCLKEWAVYLGASTTLILAGELYTVMPNPATGAALVAAAGVWEKSLNSLLVCQANGALGL
jgi:hypothetical protein